MQQCDTQPVTQPETFVSNDRPQGWRAETTIDLEARRVLRISTYRNLNHKLVTTATVHLCKESGVMVHQMGFGTGGDFSQTLLKASVPRLTRAVVQEQHNRALATLASVKVQIAYHYSIPKNANACADADLDLNVTAKPNLEDSHVHVPN